MSTLADAAFGDCPGRWPLPDATTPLERWQRAVAAGGQGRYASATSDLDTLSRTPSLGSLASLAHSTRASFLRQLGGHVSARSWDGYAWALAGSDAEAGADALIGLAADALGVGRFAASARLLRRAGAIVGDDVPARSKVRLAWVTAELAMVTGDGFAAVGHARRAAAASESTSSVRHAVKSQVVLAAALCCAGDLGESRRVADAALAAAQHHGLVPLSWALACLLVDVGSSAYSPAEVVSVRDDAADTVRNRGGVWSGR
jgi:hypothetical protein